MCIVTDVYTSSVQIYNSVTGISLYSVRALYMSMFSHFFFFPLFFGGVTGLWPPLPYGNSFLLSAAEGFRIWGGGLRKSHSQTLTHSRSRKEGLVNRLGWK